MSNGDNVSAVINFIKRDPLGRLTAVIIGIIITVFAYQNYFIPSKDEQLNEMQRHNDTKDELIRLKEERLKQSSDKANYLALQLEYFPVESNRQIGELKKKNDNLRARNDELMRLNSKLSGGNRGRSSDLRFTKSELFYT